MAIPRDPDRRRTFAARLIFLGLFLASTGAVGYLLAIPVASVLARIAFWIVVALVVAWVAWRAYQRLLWHVSGRLAFSYFLIGVVPIPLALALVFLVAYLISGFFLGHLYRDTLEEVALELETYAAHGGTVAEPAVSADGAPPALATYEEGRKVSGDPRAPEIWPAWLVAEPGEPRTGFAVLEDGVVTLAAASGGAAGEDGTGTLVFYGSAVAELLRDRSRLWVTLLPATAESDERGISVDIGGAGFNVGSQQLSPEEKAELETRKRAYFAEDAVTDGWRDRPFLNWVELEPAPHTLATGEPTADEMAVLLTTTPRILARRLFSPSAELGQAFWVGLFVVGLLLLAGYAVAELVALALIFALSRAVSRLYAATSRVAAGDFSVRIPVRRQDQVGALQRSFNSMAENLEDLVATVAQQELLEKELQMARQVQQSLLPRDLPEGEALEFSTLFEPSAAIGGDYFDVLRLSDHELAVVVADVSGHGLPTGLRMAMVKAALGILINETDRDAEEILRCLDATVRSGGGAGDESRFFVTAVFTRVDFREGYIDITNAGHPPTYVLRNGEVEEILLPGAPLGGLGHFYGRRRVDLLPGDVVVWLSDGLIEAADRDGEPVGYDGIEAAIAGPGDSAAQVRDRLLAAVAAHTGGLPASDDRTLVVMRYRGPTPPKTQVD